MKAIILFLFISSSLLFAGNKAAKSYTAADTAVVNVVLVTDEADAVLRILEKINRNEKVTETDWDNVFSSEGYKRLKEREASMNRSFEDSDFKSFVLADTTVASYQSLAATLVAWKKIDIHKVAQKPLAYLPENATIKAKIYPVIKPKKNSFVFQMNTDPAIFLYLNPKISAEKFENTLAHELHHIGYGTCCPPEAVKKEIDSLPANIKPIVNWLGAFGEGFAMLAAAGSPDIYPHAVSGIEDRTRWDNDMANYNSDLKKVETFFLDILHGKLKTENEINNVAFSFFGIQGPWYTVGWKMCATIEKEFGREALIDCMCDMRQLLPTYNAAAGKYNKTADQPLAIWSDELIVNLK